MSESLLRKIWKSLFGLSLVCFIWISSLFLVQLYSYLKLSKVAPVEILEWIPVEVKSDKYLTMANYSFECGGRIVEGFYRFDKPIFLNKPSCDATLEKMAQRSWQIYYNPKNVDEASLQHMFPIKNLIHTLLALAVVIYFFWFRDYIVRLLPG